MPPPHKTQLNTRLEIMARKNVVLKLTSTRVDAGRFLLSLLFPLAVCVEWFPCVATSSDTEKCRDWYMGAVYAVWAGLSCVATVVIFTVQWLVGVNMLKPNRAFSDALQWFRVHLAMAVVPVLTIVVRMMNRKAVDFPKVHTQEQVVSALFCVCLLVSVFTVVDFSARGSLSVYTTWDSFYQFQAVVMVSLYLTMVASVSGLFSQGLSVFVCVASYAPKWIFYAIGVSWLNEDEHGRWLKGGFLDKALPVVNALMIYWGNITHLEILSVLFVVGTWMYLVSHILKTLSPDPSENLTPSSLKIAMVMANSFLVLFLGVFIFRALLEFALGRRGLWS